ncbi:RNA recognition motif domain containing protein [Rhodotorula toruloides]|uniref:RNA recognition motif domain containing protein n=1 Tax=Rhodotorula toruloides TaxID=5286 RepID=A0A511K7E9_RHOTO|nr:RNA recognition motif domain containing protein [Rhodotorula toruloides]
MNGNLVFLPKRGGSGGRPGPQRVNSAGGRASPYSRPPPAAPAADGKWQHDLFSANSDLYNPSINFSAIRAKLPAQQETSPSLRPFGAATPAAQPVLSAPAAPVAIVQHGAAALGIKGSNAAAQREAARRANVERMAAQKERAELMRERKELEKERQEKIKIAKEEDLGFVVQVDGLVTGTSAEDVQTAFGSYGEIRFCFIVDPAASELSARLTFTRYDDAAAACSKLDGAIADGRPLQVKQVSRTPMPPPLPPLPKHSVGPALVGTSPAAVARAGVPTGPRSQRRAQPAQVQTAIPVEPPSKMYADQVEAAERAVAATAAAQNGGDGMDVDMADSAAIPTGPRGRGAAPRGRGPVHASGVVAATQQQRQQQAINPLAARLGVNVPSGPAAMRQQGGNAGLAGRAQGAPAAGSLAARLDVSGQATSGAGGAKGGRGGRGGGQATSAGQGGSSLLARLK